MLGIEDVASYGDFFSSEEWNAIHTGDCSLVPNEDWDEPGSSEQVSSGVAVNGPDCAAQRDPAAPEDSLAARANENHSVEIVAIDELDDGAYDLECEACGYLGTADTWLQAQAIARLHEQFVAVLVDRWEVS